MSLCMLLEEQLLVQWWVLEQCTLTTTCTVTRGRFTADAAMETSEARVFASLQRLEIATVHSWHVSSAIESMAMPSARQPILAKLLVAVDIPHHKALVEMSWQRLASFPRPLRRLCE